MSVAVSRSFDLNRLELLTESDMRDVGDFHVRRMRTRTESGVDVDGAAFVPYSASYAIQKRKALGHGLVDLTVSGRMLNDMQVTSVESTDTSRTVVIGFISRGGGMSGGTFIQRSRSLGAADKAIYNNPRREFFGASKADEDAIGSALERVIAERLRSQGA